MIDTPTVEAAEIWLDRGSRRYELGETLKGRYLLKGWREAGLLTTELSILWHTTGQGEEDFGVFHFQRRREASLPNTQGEAPHLFEVELPQGPGSYDGVLLKICWVVRLRGFFRLAKERVIEVPFWLGAEELQSSEKAKQMAASDD